MKAKLIDGKAIAAAIKQNAAERTAILVKNGARPCLAVIIVGENPASKIYVKNKSKACEECGVISRRYALPEGTSEKELLSLISSLNDDKGVDGILCQLPLPKHISEVNIIGAISPEKDVDGFHPVNVGNLLSGRTGFAPCTPAGIIEMLKRERIQIEGRHCVVIGRSNIVGKPAAFLMLRENATVTICHSKTKNLKDFALSADIVICAVGKPRFITADMIKSGAAVIDVGMNRLPDGRLCGDVDFESVCEKAGAITPTPGGVGPMTIAMLMQNTVKSCENRHCAAFMAGKS